MFRVAVVATSEAVYRDPLRFANQSRGAPHALPGDDPLQHLEGDGDHEGVVEEREHGVYEHESPHGGADHLDVAGGERGAQGERE